MGVVERSLTSTHLSSPSGGVNGSPYGELVSLLDQPGLEPRLSTAELRALMEWMIRLRVYDERLTLMHRQGRVAFTVASTGEEACMIGSACALQPEDWVFPAYREQGVALYRGYPLVEMLGQMIGTSADPMCGRQMPNHFGSRAHRIATVSSPVGTQIPQAAGAAWAARLRGENCAVAVYFGDGATSTGDFHAGMNQAAVAGLPVVFFCRNNGWAISMPASRQTSSRHFADKAIAYGMPAVRVDGNDVLAVYSASVEALARARAEGPVFVELVSQRMGSHSTADDAARYRGECDMDLWGRRDPVERYAVWLTERGLWAGEDEARCREEAEQWFRDGLREAEAAPPPPAVSLIRDVYAETPWHLCEELAERLEPAG